MLKDKFKMPVWNHDSTQAGTSQRPREDNSKEDKIVNKVKSAKVIMAIMKEWVNTNKKKRGSKENHENHECPMQKGTRFHKAESAEIQEIRNSTEGTVLPTNVNEDCSWQSSSESLLKNSKGWWKINSIAARWCKED